MGFHVSRARVLSFTALMLAELASWNDEEKKDELKETSARFLFVRGPATTEEDGTPKQGPLLGYVHFGFRYGLLLHGFARCCPSLFHASGIGLYRHLGHVLRSALSGWRLYHFPLRSRRSVFLLL